MIDPRRLALSIAAIVAASACAAGNTASDGLLSMADVMALDASRAERLARDGQARLREELVRDAALALGTQGGYSERASEIRGILDRRGDQLDRIFNFAPLCRDGRVLSPVVDLVEDVLAVEAGGDAMRETARVLRVLSPARLVSTPPTWRDWMDIRPIPSVAPDVVSLPTTSSERDVWRETVATSWALGRTQADAVFASQVDTLKRDYQGMLRYHELLNQGIVAPADVGRNDLGIVREDAELRLGDTIYVVRSPARFTPPEDWRAVVTPSGTVREHAGED